MTSQKSLLPSAESTAALLSGVLSEQQKFRARATEIIATLDAKIAEKNAEHRQLLGAVSIDSAVALVLHDVAESAKDERRQALSLIKSAGFLNQYIAIDIHSGFDGNGEPSYGTTSPKPLHLLRDLSASGLVSILPDLFLPAIEALVRQELTNAGNPVTGLSISALKQQADTVFAELRNLNDQRIKSVKLLDSLVCSELKVPPEFYAIVNRPPNADQLSPNSTPQVRHFDDGGKPVQKVYGLGWEEMMLANELRERDERAAQLKRDMAEFGEFSEGETYDTLRAKKA